MAKKYVIAAQDRLGMSREETAEYIGTSPTTFDGMVLDRSMPPAKMIKTRKVWHRPSVEKAFALLPDDGQNGEVSNPYAV